MMDLQDDSPHPMSTQQLQWGSVVAKTPIILDVRSKSVEEP